MKKILTLGLADIMGGNLVSFTIDPDRTEAQEAERLWQAMSEEAYPDMSREEWEESGNAAEWENLPDDTIEELLSAAQKAGFVESWEVEEVDD